MSKKLLYLLGILLTIIVGTILHRSLSCDCASLSGKKEVAPADKSIVVIPAEKPAELSTAASDSAATKKWQAAREKINADPLIVYFKFGKAEISTGQDVKDKVTKLTDYLNNVPGSELVITGHTDNTGAHGSNIRLGQERADNTKSLLVQNGIAEGRIICLSRGPDEPAADNSTPEGRVKNRRTVTLIK
jgi:OmpA-OmpF porin, OOP family